MATFDIFGRKAKRAAKRARRAQALQIARLRDIATIQDRLGRIGLLENLFSRGFTAGTSSIGKTLLALQDKTAQARQSQFDLQELAASVAELQAAAASAQQITRVALIAIGGIVGGIAAGGAAATGGIGAVTGPVGALGSAATGAVPGGILAGALGGAGIASQLGGALFSGLPTGGFSPIAQPIPQQPIPQPIPQRSVYLKHQCRPACKIIDTFALSCALWDLRGLLARSLTDVEFELVFSARVFSARE